MDVHHAAMQEIELKLQVPRTRRAAVDAAVAGRAPAPRVRLQATYFDTPDRALAQAGLALRVRREGRRTVQTLKAAGDDGLTRAEHNMALDAQGSAAAGALRADPHLHAGTQVGDRLLALLAQTGQPLAAVYRTDIRRRSRTLRTRLGVVELAFDEGFIAAGDRRLPVCELEIELVRGSPLAVIAAGRHWSARHALWLDGRSKAERGDLLARGESAAPPALARPVSLGKDTPLDEGARQVMLACLDQIGRNASQVASGEFEAEHVHQLRIGLRRLRTALRLFGDAVAGVPGGPSLAAQAAQLFRGLGAARDAAAIGEPIERELSEALLAAGLVFQVPRLPLPADAPVPADLLRAAASQQLLLDLLALAQGRDPGLARAADAPALQAFVAKRLNRWHRKAVDDAKRWNELDDVGRHRLRKRVKRLRYAVEFCGDLFDGRRVRRYLKRLRALQTQLGAVVDVTMALDAYRGGSAADPHALFAVGWLTARRARLLSETARPAEAFAEVKRFWKKA